MLAPSKDKTHRRQCKMWSSKKIYLWKDFAAGVYLFEAQKPPPPPTQTLYCARNDRPSFHENMPKTLVLYDWKRAFWACFHENWVYKFRHSTCSHREGGGGGWTMPTWLTVSPVNKLWETPAAKSLYRYIFRVTTFCIEVCDSLAWCKSGPCSNLGPRRFFFLRRGSRGKSTSATVAKFLVPDWGI